MKVIRGMVRVYLAPEDLDKTVDFYEALFGQGCDMRFKYEEAGLEMASVGSVLLIAGRKGRLRPFRETWATFLVDSLDSFSKTLLEIGADILEEPKVVPTGRNMRVRHPDGVVIEYVEHANKRAV
jgi:predicted enzyme related to lactoylglutathione lyase